MTVEWGFKCIQDGWVELNDNEYSSTLISHYYKGLNAVGDNAVLVLEDEEMENEC